MSKFKQAQSPNTETALISLFIVILLFLYLKRLGKPSGWLDILSINQH